MSEWKKGWKIIEVETRLSCTSTRRTKPLVYDVNTVTKRVDGFGPLAVFRRKLWASLFRRRATKFLGVWEPQLQLKIVKCLYKPSEDDRLWEIYIFEPADLASTHYMKHTPPWGTKYADEVKCLE